MRRFLITAAMAATMTWPQAGAAQQTLFDAAAVAATCAAGGCAAAVQGTVNALAGQNLTPAQMNSQLAILAAALVQAAQAAPAGAADDYATALQVVAAASSDGAQAQAIRQAAAAVSGGNAGVIDLETGFAASGA